MLQKQPIFLPPRGLFGSVSRSRQVSVVVPLILLTFLGVLFAPPELRAEVTVKEALSFFQSSDAQMEAVRKGEIVKVTASETEESGLPVGLIMLARRSPERIIEYVREAPIYKAIPMITAYGEIKGKGTLADFAGVKLEPNGVEEAGRYLKAAPGEEINLDVKEIASFRALNAEGQKTAAQQKKVEALVRSTLLTRYRAYRAAGLSGIAPYDRGDGEAFHPGEELRTRLEKFEFLPEKSRPFTRYSSSIQPFALRAWRRSFTGSISKSLGGLPLPCLIVQSITTGAPICSPSGTFMPATITTRCRPWHSFSQLKRECWRLPCIGSPRSR